MMSIANLPTENANEPLEDARQSKVQHSVKQNLRSKKPNKNLSTHTETLDRAQKNRSYKEILSQPLQELSHKQKLLWLQKRRSTGLWVQCDDCDRWRYLDTVLDSYELPNKWYCRMNPDSKFASCSIPETPLQVREEEDLIHSKYSAGSVVWARMPGWPWWPAMVDDCPDTEQFYWLDGFSDIPTHFNVVFFDVNATRAWMSSEQLRHYTTNQDMYQNVLKNGKYMKRLETAVAQANDAVTLPLIVRLAKYSFIARYKGKISTPKKIDRFFIQKYQNQLKRKFNIDFPIESSSDSDDDDNITRDIKKNGKQATIQKRTKTTKTGKEPKCLNAEIVDDNESKILVQDCAVENESAKENSSSMAVQVSDHNSTAALCLSTDNGTDNATLVLDTCTQEIEKETISIISIDHLIDNIDLQKINSSPSFEFD